MMKKIVYLTLCMLPLAGCVGKKEKQQLLQQNDSLALVVAAKDSLISDVFTSLNEIAENLNQIKTREKLIASNIGNAEIQKEPAVRIAEDIQAIDQLLENNRQSIVRLERNAAQLRQANVKIASLEGLIAELNTQVESKDNEIVALKDQLSRMNIEVSELSTTITGLTQEKTKLEGEVKTQGDLLSTAYYIVGSQKELLNSEIIYKSGFVGRTLKINENRSLDSFTQVDTRTFDEVIIGKKNVRLVSVHPNGSYEFVMNDAGTFLSLVITNRESFWEYSKVLVISYK